MVVRGRLLRRLAFVSLVLVSCGCDKIAKLIADRQKPAESPGAEPSVAPVVGQARGADVGALIAAGRADEALAQLQAAPATADTPYWQGVAWAKKAEAAPLPTPPPPPSPAVRGTPAPLAPEFKPEELTAVDFFEKALQQRADHPRASLDLARLLTPHTARRYDFEQAAKGKRPAPPKKGARPQPVETPGDVREGPDFSVTRVAQLYQAALQGAPNKIEPVEAYVKFCMRVGLLDEADAALRELVKRDREKPEPLIRYGDFLGEVRKDPQAALEQYRQALIWSPDNSATKARIADIYITMGIENYSKLQYAAAESRFNEAAKYVTDSRSPQGLKIQDYMGKLGAIRKLPTH
jgi:tetratricopeptide (TPR) repeat protein